jgi:hypothetical protein
MPLVQKAYQANMPQGGMPAGASGGMPGGMPNMDGVDMSQFANMMKGMGQPETSSNTTPQVDEVD